MARTVSGRELKRRLNGRVSRWGSSGVEAPEGRAADALHLPQEGGFFTYGEAERRRGAAKDLDPFGRGRSE